MKSNRGTPDFLLLFLTIGLIGFGIVMIYSSSFTISYWEYENKWYFTSKQIFFSIIGLILMIICMNLRLNFYKKYYLFFLFGSILLLLLVFVPGIGIELNGARSWIGFGSETGSKTIQPTEFAKLGLIIYLSALLSKKKENITDLKKGLLPPLTVILIFIILIALQPDFGTVLILTATAGVILIIGGARLKHIFFLIIICLTALPIIFLSAGYRLSRLTSYLNPWSDPYGDGYHLIQSLIAFGNGGILGAGFGKGIQKYFYLPYPQSDFIFSVIGEELGFVGITIFILMFLLFIWRIFFIALRSNDTFGTLLGVGIASLFAIQAFVNIGGVTGAIPITGVTLPFISAGGSSLIVCMISVGIVLSISRENE